MFARSVNPTGPTSQSPNERSSHARDGSAARSRVTKDLLDLGAAEAPSAERARTSSSHVCVSIP